MPEFKTNRFKNMFFVLGLTLCAVVAMPQAAEAQSGTTSDPCPEPKDALQNTPNSMAKIQEDINRFTLCVERAQLLDRLNSLVEGNLDTIDSVILQPQNLPPLPTAGDTASATGNAGEASAGQAQPAAPAPIDEAALAPSGMGMGEGPSAMAIEPKEEEPSWLIREINGRSGSLRASLVSSDGKLARVQQGETLPDDSRVIEISPTNVRIKKEQDIVSLDWVTPSGGEEE